MLLRHSAAALALYAAYNRLLIDVCAIIPRSAVHPVAHAAQGPEGHWLAGHGGHLYHLLVVDACINAEQLSTGCVAPRFLLNLLHASGACRGCL